MDLFSEEFLRKLKAFNDSNFDFNKPLPSLPSEGEYDNIEALEIETEENENKTHTALKGSTESTLSQQEMSTISSSVECIPQDNQSIGEKNGNEFSKGVEEMEKSYTFKTIHCVGRMVEIKTLIPPNYPAPILDNEYSRMKETFDNKNNMLEDIKHARDEVKSEDEKNNHNSVWLIKKRLEKLFVKKSKEKKLEKPPSIGNIRFKTIRSFFNKTE